MKPFVRRYLKAHFAVTVVVFLRGFPSDAGELLFVAIFANVLGAIGGLIYGFFGERIEKFAVALYQSLR